GVKCPRLAPTDPGVDHVDSPAADDVVAISPADIPWQFFQRRRERRPEVSGIPVLLLKTARRIVGLFVLVDVTRPCARSEGFPWERYHHLNELSRITPGPEMPVVLPPVGAPVPHPIQPVLLQQPGSVGTEGRQSPWGLGTPRPLELLEPFHPGRRRDGRAC